MPEKRVTVRVASSSDRDSVWPLARDFATSFQPEKPIFDHSYAQLLESTDALVIVATDGSSKIVGYLLAHLHLTFLANGPVAWVEEVMVRSDARRAGIGRSLMATAEAWADARGAAYLALASRRAGEFYRALGYDDSAVFFKKTLTAQ